MNYLPFAVVAVVSYLIGSIPFGFVFAKSQGVDIRTVGSRNIGATNVLRVLGKKWGALTFACDFLKGLLPLMALPLLFEVSPLLKLVCAVCAMLGIDCDGNGRSLLPLLDERTESVRDHIRFEDGAVMTPEWFLKIK